MIPNGNNIFHAFAPLIGENPKILILGTFPSPVSREKGEYYGNAQNKFWKIIFDVFETRFDAPNYNEKKKLLFARNLALWDVIERCEITGAADSAIKNPVYNAKLPELIKRPGILQVAFNGAKAREFYLKGIGNINGIILPSTSPANARLSYNEKFAAWAQALKPVLETAQK